MLSRDGTRLHWKELKGKRTESAAVGRTEPCDAERGIMELWAAVALVLVGVFARRCTSNECELHVTTIPDKKFFFERYGLAQADVERYLSAALSAGGDFADLYFEYQTSTSVSLDESMVKSATEGISVGCGVRVLSGERTGYAYTDDLSPERILHAARTAAMIANGPAKQPIVGLTNKPLRNLYPVPLPSVEADVMAKVDLVQRADKAARAYDPRITEVRVGYADELRRILVIGSDGSFAEDRQPLSRMSVFCIAKTETGSARGTSGGGGRVALDFFETEKTPEHFADEAARQAIIQLDAREAPAGEMEVVLGPGWPGILLHEAIGHGLEADFNRKKNLGLLRHDGTPRCQRQMHGG